VRAQANLREQQKRDRHQRIYEEALRLFRARGFQATTMSDIAKAAGVSRGTVFNYYPYKEAILLEHGARRLKRLEATVRSSRQDPVEALYVVFEHLASFTEENRDLILPLGYELLNPDVTRSKVAFEAVPLVSLVRDVLARACEAGLVRSDFSRERLARTVANTFFLTALQWAAYRSDRPIHEELRNALQLTLEGIVVSSDATRVP
jgi:AcrR family transcriptional regulator